MTLSLHTLAPAKGARKKSFRVGRGNASGRGTTAGRGTKGQRARTGGRNRLKIKGIKQMLLGFPKSRGFQSKFPTVYDVRVEKLMAAFSDGERVNLAALKARHLVPNVAARAKVIGGGNVTKKLTLVGLLATASVKEAILKAGGSVEPAKK
ncbi:50S ribosomal protein L15 [Candidatus Uhrbacteria bacterium]|nr:50S ribosomal protein L15 [Candidatus Uhrbacteria bacterium]